MILLDTNIIIPLVRDRLDRLPRAIREVLGETRPQFAASVASLWEITIKNRQGKLPLQQQELRALPEYLTVLGISVLDIGSDHVLAEVEPVPDTKDPFDRLLLATCKVERLRLLTTDAKLTSHPLAWQPGFA